MSEIYECLICNKMEKCFKEQRKKMIDYIDTKFGYNEDEGIQYHKLKGCGITTLCGKEFNF